jgi:hypothetical protein
MGSQSVVFRFQRVRQLRDRLHRTRQLVAVQVGSVDRVDTEIASRVSMPDSGSAPEPFHVLNFGPRMCSDMNHEGSCLLRYHCQIPL